MTDSEKEEYERLEKAVYPWLSKHKPTMEINVLEGTTPTSDNKET